MVESVLLEKSYFRLLVPSLPELTFVILPFDWPEVYSGVF